MKTYKFNELTVGDIVTIDEQNSKYKIVDGERVKYKVTDDPHRALLNLETGYTLPTIDAERWFVYNKIENTNE